MPSTLRTLTRGLLAGAVGTAAMTAAQTAYLKARGEEPSTTPAEVGRRIVEGVLQRDVPEERMGALNNVMHWLYGTGWGVLFGLSRACRGAAPLGDGARFAGVVWGASLVELPAMGLAPPVWEYPPDQLASDFGFHLVYGVGVATAYAVLDR
jgi:hypothetical protein